MALKVDNLEGNEIADDYVRTAGTSGRWGETWDTFKSSFGKIVLINVLMLIFFLPGVGVMIFRTIYIAGLGSTYPFNSNTGLGYPAYPDTIGLTESIYLSADLLFYSVMIIAGFIASIGIAGGAYSIKKLLNTQGKFTVKGFFHGVKVCYFNAVLPVTIFLVFYFATVIIGDWKDLTIAQGNAAAGPVTAYVFIIIATVLVGIYCAWMLAVGVSYRLKITQLIKNSFVMILAAPIHTIFFAGFSLIPVWLILIFNSITLLKVLSYFIMALMGLSFILLVWSSFAQWLFDMFVTPNLKAAEERANAKKSPKELAEEKEEEEKRVARELLAAGKSELIGKPILPIASESVVAPLGLTYTRADVNKISEQRKKLSADISAYEQEHKNDPVYAEYNKLFAEREKALQSEGGKKGKKKRVSADNLLK